MLGRFLTACLAWIALAVGAQAQIAVTDLGSNATSTGATVTITGVTVPAGATICVFIAEFTNSGSTGAVTDGTNTYTVLSRGAPNNNVSTFGFRAVITKVNASAITAATLTYTKITSGNSASISAFYVTGVTSNPIDTTVTNSATGTSAAPTVTSAAVPAVSGELIVGAVGFNGTSSSTFTQDSANGTYATPFDFNKTVNSTTTAGGNFVQAAAASITYAPAITSTAWIDFIFGLKPAATTSCGSLALLGVGC